MCNRLFEAEIYCEAGPSIEFRDGLFHVTQRVGENAIIRRCFQPGVFMASIVAALDAVEAYQATQPGCAILPFKLKAIGNH